MTHYTFGDADLAAERLERLARVFEPSLIDFMTRATAAGHLQRRERPRVLDLGCGPGWTTRTLARILAPGAIIGIDASARFVDRARAMSSPDVEYRKDDVTTADLSSVHADIAYSRFLLTHLREPSAAVSHWAGALAPGGRLLLQETARLESTYPPLARYYDLVAELQRRHGQSLTIGRELPSLVDGSVCRVVAFAETPLPVRASDMARLHAMNIQTWRHDEAARDFDRAEVDRLTDELSTLAERSDSGATLTYVIGEMVVERTTVAPTVVR